MDHPLARDEAAALLGGLLTVLGAFLPWLWNPVGGVLGVDTYGLFTLLGGGIALLLIASRGWTQRVGLAVSALGAVALAFAASYYLDLTRIVGATPGVDAGSGVWATLAGGLLLIVGGAARYVRE